MQNRAAILRRGKTDEICGKGKTRKKYYGFVDILKRVFLALVLFERCLIDLNQLYR